MDAFTFATGSRPTAAGPIVGWPASAWTCDGGATADGTQIQLWTCNGTAAQTVDAAPGSTLRALGKCLDVSGGGTADGTKIQLWTCNGTGAQNWARAGRRHAAQPAVRQVPGRLRQQPGRRHRTSHLWTCHAGANQKWTLPA